MHTQGTTSRGRVLALVLLALCSASCDSPESTPPRPRNVVLYVVDTLRADRLGCYGYPRETSPHLDALAERGTVYENNHSQGCWTVPSMISMMSGRYVTKEEERLPADVQVLAEQLQAAGIATAAFVGNMTLARDRGFQRGFEVFVPGRPNGLAASVVENFEQWYTRRYAEERDSDSRFFAWIHSIDPHHPYTPRAPFRVFDGEPRVNEEELTARWRPYQEKLGDYERSEPPLSFEEGLEDIRKISNLYDAEVRAADAALGRLLEFLDEQGELEDTLVIFASDHGEKLWEHPFYPMEFQARLDGRAGVPDKVQDFFGIGHRFWFHEELWRTPLVFAGPGMPAGARRSELSANLDLYPTIAEAFGVVPDPAAPGRSLLGGKAPEHEQVFGYGFKTTAMIDASLRKFIEHDPATMLASEPTPAPVELFDLARDPGELRNVADEDPALVENLRRALDIWRRTHDREVDTTLSEADLDALRELGYLDDEEPEEEQQQD